MSERSWLSAWRLCFSYLILFGPWSICHSWCLPALWNSCSPLFWGPTDFGFLAFSLILLFLWRTLFFCLRVSPWLALCLSQHSPYGVSFMLLAFTIMNVLLTPRVKSPAHFSLQNPRLIYSIISRIILNPYPIAYKKSIFPNSSLWHSTWHKLGAQMFFVDICIRVACFLDQLHQTVNILWARIASFSKPVSSPASSIVSVT